MSMRFVFTSSVFVHERDQRLVDLVRMRRGQEMRTALHDHEFRGRRVREQLDFLLRVGHAVDHVVGALEVEKYSRLALLCFLDPKTPFPGIRQLGRFNVTWW